MKKHLLTLSICFISLVAFAQSPEDISIIDNQDTVVFDLSQAVETPGYIEFPVKFLSDDTINAVDFSLKYNTTDFAFDTIIKLTTYLSITSNQAADTTVYLTSFSLQQITNDTHLVKVRFAVLTPGQPFCIDDLNSVAAYLNGDACSVKIIECTSSTIGIIDVENENNPLEVYPNPSGGLISLCFHSGKNETCRFVVSDMTGKVVYENQLMTSAGLNKTQTNLGFLAKGIYQVQLIAPSFHLNREIVVH